jgi:hypothetical protein
MLQSSEMCKQCQSRIISNQCRNFQGKTQHNARKQLVFDSDSDSSLSDGNESRFSTSVSPIKGFSNSKRIELTSDDESLFSHANTNECTFTPPSHLKMTGQSGHEHSFGKNHVLHKMDTGFIPSHLISYSPRTQHHKAESDVSHVLRTHYDASASLNATNPFNRMRDDTLLDDAAHSPEAAFRKDGNRGRLWQSLPKPELPAGQPTAMAASATPLLPGAERSTELRQTAAALLAVAAAAREVEAAEVEAARARRDAAAAMQAAAAAEALAGAATEEAAWLRDTIEVRRCWREGGE